MPEELSSDGGPEFVSNSTKDFLSKWGGVHHRLSSTYNPPSNGRAEVAVKSAKRLLRSNTDSSGTLDTDCFLRAMMQLRNTPDPDCNTSPAQIVFGRPIRDAFAFINRLEKFGNPNIHPVWRDAWQQKEDALRQRFHRTAEDRNKHAKSLPMLQVGHQCYVQNQTGPHSKRWDRSGTVVETNGYDSYTLKIDGTGRVTRRNRKYLRQFEPASPEIVSRGDFWRTIPIPTPPRSAPPTVHASQPTIDPTFVTSTSRLEGGHVDHPLPTSPLPGHQNKDEETGGPIEDVSEPPDAVDTVPSERNSSPKLRRVTRPPRKYIPETGTWD